MIVNFETKCYERDWQYVIESNKILKLLDNLSFSFNKRTLYINNVINITNVAKNADKLISKNIIDEYIVVDDYAKNTLEFFEISIDSFKGGYYYSISELVSIYLNNSDFIVHFSSDTDMSNKYDWITDAINIMSINSQVSVANPSWSTNISFAEPLFNEDDLFFYEKGSFSDQCYLIRTNEFKNKIYNEYNILSDRYPPHGGNSFEKRVDSYLHNHNKLRITSKKSFYTSSNI